MEFCQDHPLCVLLVCASSISLFFALSAVFNLWVRGQIVQTMVKEGRTLAEIEQAVAIYHDPTHDALRCMYSIAAGTSHHCNGVEAMKEYAAARVRLTSIPATAHDDVNKFYCGKCGKVFGWPCKSAPCPNCGETSNIWRKQG